LAKAALELRQLMSQVALAQIDLNKSEVATGRLGQWRGALGWALKAWSALLSVLRCSFDWSS
jgi:hypothetical protein